MSAAGGEADETRARRAELSAAKGRRAGGRGTVPRRCIYVCRRGMGEFAAGARASYSFYCRNRTVLMPEWCAMQPDRALNESRSGNTADVIYRCPEMAAENGLYCMRKSGPNTGASLTRGCLRCRMNTVYNIKAAEDLRRYFDGADAARVRQIRDEYGIRKGVNGVRNENDGNA